MRMQKDQLPSRAMGDIGQANTNCLTREQTGCSC